MIFKLGWENIDLLFIYKFSKLMNSYIANHISNYYFATLILLIWYLFFSKLVIRHFLCDNRQIMTFPDCRAIFSILGITSCIILVGQKTCDTKPSWQASIAVIFLPPISSSLAWKYNQMCCLSILIRYITITCIIKKSSIIYDNS